MIVVLAALVAAFAFVFVVTMNEEIGRSTMWKIFLLVFCGCITSYLSGRMLFY